MINLHQIEKEITQENLRTSKIITIALNLGVALFAFVCFVLYLRGTEAASNETEIIDILLIILFILTSTIHGFSTLLPKRVLIKNLKQSEPNIIGAFNNYQIMKLAMYEAPALFGLVIIILGITNESIYTNEYAFVAIAPMIAMFTFSLLNFPTEFKVKSFLKSVIEELELK